MSEILEIITVAIALSMDTFSLSLGIGTTNLSSKKRFLFPLLVGILHFLMPLLGNIIGINILELFSLNTRFLLGVILIYLAITMLIESLKEKKTKTLFSVIELFILAITVSIDSFTTGLGLSAISNNILLSVSIFSIVSLSFTYLGLLIGKYGAKLLGVYSSILGSILLLILGIVNLCK